MDDATKQRLRDAVTVVSFYVSVIGALALIAAFLYLRITLAR